MTQDEIKRLIAQQAPSRRRVATPTQLRRSVEPVRVTEAIPAMLVVVVVLALLVLAMIGGFRG